MDWFLYGMVGQLPTVWSYIGIFLVSLMGTIAGVTLFLHRSQAHGAVVFHPVITHFLRFWLWITTGMITKEWVAIHRKHHAFTDKPGDPHTPIGKKPLAVLFLVFDYLKATNDPSIMARYGHGTPDDWVEREVYSRHPVVGIVLGAMTALFLFGAGPGLLLTVAHALWIPFWAACVINGLGHLSGYRNYATPDNSRNTWPFFSLAIWIGGEELHNNHHAYPTSAKFSQRWFEFDIGWGAIVLLSWFGLATVKHRAPVMRIDPTKKECDQETVRAILQLRYDVLHRFDRLKWEVDEAYRASRNSLFQSHRERLISLWSDRKATEETILQMLREWQQRLMKSRVPALEQFARELPTLTLKNA